MLLTKKLVIAASIGVLYITSSQAIAQEYKTIKTIGVSAPVCVGGIETATELQQYVQSNKQDFLGMLSQSGWPGNADELVSRIASGDFSDVSIPVGTKFEWMGVRHKSSGQADIDDFIRWGGDSALAAFTLKAQHDNKIYTFALPKACCNLALLTQVENAPVPAVVPPKELVGLAVAEDKGLGIIPYVAPMLGYQRRQYEDNTWNNVTDDGFALGGAVGLMYPVTDTTKVFTQLGYLFDTGESENDALFVDLGVNQNISKNVFVGGGVGYWYIDSDLDTENDSSVSLFGQLGYDVSDNVQVFTEARAHSSGLDGQTYLLGLRYLFQ